MEAQVPRALVLNVGRNLGLAEVFRLGLGRCGVESVFGYVEFGDPVAHSGMPVRRHLSPDHDEFEGHLESIVSEDSIDILIPTRDDELVALSRLALRRPDLFVAVSSGDFLSICLDKLVAFQAFSSFGISLPTTWLPHEAPPQPIEPEDEVFVKPRRGSAGVGIKKVRFKHAAAASRALEQPLLQTVQSGIEHTFDVYITGAGAPAHYVCRKRTRTSGGQSVRGETVYSPRGHRFITAVASACAAAGGRYLLNVQAFDDGSAFCLGEVNGRVAAGFPLSFEAGASYPDFVACEADAREIVPAWGRYETGVAFARATIDLFWRTHEGRAPTGS